MDRISGSILIKIALLIFVVYLVTQVLALQLSLNEKKDKLALLNQTAASLEIENEQLRNLIDSGNEKNYIERIARERLGYAYANEDVFIDASGK